MWHPPFFVLQYTIICVSDTKPSMRASALVGLLAVPFKQFLSYLLNILMIPLSNINEDVGKEITIQKCT